MAREGAERLQLSDTRSRTPGFTAEASLYPSDRSYRATGGAPHPARGLVCAGQALVDYDPRWPLAFEGERRRIAAALGTRAVVIEHVGSSAVPGLSGRAEVDILVGVRSPDDVEESARAMAGLGYVTSDQGSTDGWRLMSRPGAIPFEALIVEHLSPLWRRHLGFRDDLRSDPVKAHAYGRLKSEWAARHGAGTDGYKEAKRQFWTSIPETATR